MTENVAAAESAEKTSSPSTARRAAPSGLLIGLGAALALACLVVGMGLVGRFLGDPASLPGVWTLALLAVGFQLGFTLYACGLASRGPRAVYAYLPLALLLSIVAGGVAGVASYLASSGIADMTYLKPKADAAWGWELEQEKKGLHQFSVTYTQEASMGGRALRSTLTISAARQRRPPIGQDEWSRREAALSKEPKQVGPLKRANRKVDWITLGGQRALKVVDTMSGGPGPAFIQARYWWYSPKLKRVLTGVAMVDASSEWKLKSIERMLDSIPTQ